jgi:hypothetical protein
MRCGVVDRRALDGGGEGTRQLRPSPCRGREVQLGKLQEMRSLPDEDPKQLGGSFGVAGSRMPAAVGEPDGGAAFDQGTARPGQALPGAPPP